MLSFSQVFAWLPSNTIFLLFYLFAADPKIICGEIPCSIISLVCVLIFVLFSGCGVNDAGARAITLIHTQTLNPARGVDADQHALLRTQSIC